MRRVPQHVRHLDNRRFVKKSLRTRERKIAVRRSILHDDYFEEFWLGLIENDDTCPASSYDLAIKQARHLGIEYRPIDKITNSKTDEIINRIEIAVNKKDDPRTVEAVLGTVDLPKYSFEQLWEEFFAFQKPKLRHKSAEQAKRWINPRVRAYKTFVEVIGDIDVKNVTRQHVLDFRSWWAKRLESENMSANSANKDLTHIRSMLSYAQDNKDFIDFDVVSLFARVRFDEQESERQPLSTVFIKDTLLNPTNLKGLNDECRFFLYAMADTGARPSELVGLNAHRGDIRLDTDIPYIHIRPDSNRELKNKHCERQLPLVGAALYAFQQLPQGFQHYFQKPDQLSAVLNKFLRDNGILTEKHHSVYSLRHSFEDRLCEVNTIEKVQASIMGHAYSRERYGNGPSLEQKAFWMNKMKRVCHVEERKQ